MNRSPSPISGEGPPEQHTANRGRLGSTRAEELSTRVDEYLSVTRLGREAFADGDLKLAKDRFSLSMNIELDTDLECMCGATVGKATGELRQELETRFNGFPQFLAGITKKDRYSKVMSSLERAFVEAEQKMARCPGDPEPYLQMASALIMVNEWEKAKQVYCDGIANCLDDMNELKRGLERLSKVEQLAMLFQQSKTDKTRRRKRAIFSSKGRPSSELILMNTSGTLPRSSSFDLPDGLTNSRSPPPSPLHSPTSPRKNINGSLVSAIASPMAHRRSSLKKLFTMRKKNTPVSPIIDKRKSLQVVTSLSMEDISSIGRSSMEDRKYWRQLFKPEQLASCLDDGLSTRSVQQMRMLGAMDLVTLTRHKHTIPAYSLEVESRSSEV